MKHVFISYTRKDSDIVELIESDLVDSGHEVWRDASSIRGGDDWSVAIEEAIRHAYVFIVVLSSAALESDWVNREIAFALQRAGDLPVIPVTLERFAVLLERFDVPATLQKTQIVDFTPIREIEGIELIRAYREALHRLLQDLEETRPVLRYLKALKDSDAAVREASAQQLGHLGDPFAASALIEALSDDDVDVRFEATKALGTLQSRSAYKHLVRLLNDDDPDLRAAAADALGNLGIPHAVGSLLPLLEDADRFVRQSAARALGKLKEIGAVVPLILLMRNDGISNVREAAAEALCMIGGPEAERAIRRVEQSEENSAQGTTASRLQKTLHRKTRRDQNAEAHDDTFGLSLIPGFLHQTIRSGSGSMTGSQ